MVKVKAKKIQAPQSPKPAPRVMMHRGRHRSMRTQVDSMRALLVNLKRELEVTYVNVAVEMAFNPKPCPTHVEVYMMMCQAHTATMRVIKAMENHAEEEYPDGIPDTV
jgi:hypothetical protein